MTGVSEEQGAFGAEPLYERARGEARLCNLPQCQFRGPTPLHHPHERGKDTGS
jgi:hypothetical protein